MNGSMGYLGYASLWTIHSLWLAWKLCGKTAHSSNDQIHILWLKARHGSELHEIAKQGWRQGQGNSLGYLLNEQSAQCVFERNLVKGSQPYYLSSTGVDVLSH